jgi:serine/threonine protein kinase
MDQLLSQSLFDAFCSAYSYKYTFDQKVPIGDGAYGVVYKAMDIDRKIEVAIKFFHEGIVPFGSDRGWQFTSRIMHHQIAPTFTVEQITNSDGKTYKAVVSRFVPGHSLKEVFNWWNNQLPLDRALIAEDFSNTFLLSLIEALEVCHTHGFGHGDLHEGNVMVILKDYGMIWSFGAILIDFDNASLKTELNSATEKEKMQKDVRLLKNRLAPYITDEWKWGSYLHQIYQGYEEIFHLKFAIKSYLEFIQELEKNNDNVAVFRKALKLLLPKSLGGVPIQPVIRCYRAVSANIGLLDSFNQTIKDMQTEILEGQMLFDEDNIELVHERKDLLYRSFFK